MPTHVHMDFELMMDAMKGVQKMQRLAEAYNIPNIFTDNGGKLLQVLVATGLDFIPGRTGPDAKDRLGRMYEIKTTDVNANVGGFGTSHHLSMSIIDRYRSHDFIFAIFDKVTMLEAYRVKTTDLEPIFADWEDRLFDTDHLNNPKIPLALVREVGDVVYFKDVPAPWTPGTRRRIRPYKYGEMVERGLVKAA